MLLSLGITAAIIIIMLFNFWEVYFLNITVPISSRENNGKKYFTVTSDPHILNQDPEVEIKDKEIIKMTALPSVVKFRDQNAQMQFSHDYENTYSCGHTGNICTEYVRALGKSFCYDMCTCFVRTIPERIAWWKCHLLKYKYITIRKFA